MRIIKKHKKRQKIVLLKVICLCFLCISLAFGLMSIHALPITLATLAPKDSEAIKWVDFNVTYEAMAKAMDIDIRSFGQEVHICWIDILAYLGAKYGGNFRNYRSKDIEALVERLQNGETIETITADMKHFAFYRRAYGAVLAGFIGEYEIELQATNGDPNRMAWQPKYGLKAFFPIAEGFYYTHFNDFGVSRSYGFKRRHLGHDLMVQVGTPVIAIESGIVEIMGWNQYGGWRIGIRSFDGLRYYYYAHLRKDHPFNSTLREGMVVTAGDVIGYSGRTGYSIRENVNNIATPHLHVGMQLVFEESEKESPNQIWIDLYAISRLLSKNRATVYRNEESGEYYRKYRFAEPNYFVVSTREQRAATAEDQSVSVPIIMYHGLIKDRKLQTRYFICPSAFEEDLKYLQRNGYTTIVMQDLINFVDHGTPLPEKPIILTFDDGYYNNYHYAYPLLQKYNKRAVFSIIGKYTEEYSLEREFHAAYSHLSWNHINQMIITGHGEFQNHTFNMHTSHKGRQGAAQKHGESIEVYSGMLNDDIGKLQDRMREITGLTPTTFTYPFGFISDSSRDILKEMGFRATLSCREGVNQITRNPDDLFSLKRYLRSPERSVQEILSINN